MVPKYLMAEVPGNPEEANQQLIDIDLNSNSCSSIHTGSIARRVHAKKCSRDRSI